MSEYIYSAISSRRICAAYARFGSQSHLDRHEALSCIRPFAPKRASPASLRLCGSVLSVKLSDIPSNYNVSVMPKSNSNVADPS